MLEITQASGRISLGGDCLNALSTAGYLGLKSGLHTSVADDENKAQIEKLLSPLPLKIFSHPAPGKNGKYYISTDESGERSFEYDRKGSAASHLPDVLVDINLDSKCLFLSGVAQALTPKWTIYVEKLLLLAKTQKVQTAFDINFRAKLWSQEEASLALKTCLRNIDVLLVSEDDLPVLFEAQGSKELSKLFEFGIKHCVLRKGAEGAGLLEKSGALKMFKAPKVSVKDTSGCGDVFAGTFLAKYLAGKSLDEAMQLATNLASKHAEFPGALPRPELFKEQS